MTGSEIVVLLNLLVKLGMQVADAIALLRQHGVTDAQLAAADAENEISVHERIEQLEGK